MGSRGRLLLEEHLRIIFMYIKVMDISAIHHLDRWKRQSVNMRTELK